MIVVVGPACAGKDTFCQAAQNSGVSAYNISNDVWGAYDTSGAHTAGQDIADFVASTRRCHGDAYFLRLTLERIQRNEVTSCVISGCRTTAEIELIRETWDATVVGIYADALTRYQRAVARGRDDAPQSFEEFLRRDYRELTWGLATIMVKAETIMLNMGGLTQFLAEVSEYVEIRPK